MTTDRKTPVFLLLLGCLLLSGCGKKESAEGLMKQAGEITGFRGVLTAELLTRGKTEDHPSRFQGTLESVPGELYLTGDSFMGDRQSEDRKNYYRQIPGEEKLEFSAGGCIFVPADLQGMELEGRLELLNITC